MTGVETLVWAALAGAVAGLCVEVGIILGVYATDFHRHLEDGLSWRRLVWLWARWYPAYVRAEFSVDRDDCRVMAKYTAGFALVGAAAAVTVALISVGFVEVVS